MGLTYTRGADVQRRRAQRVAITLGEHLLVVTSVVVALAIALAYLGRTRAETLVTADRAAPINLNAGPDAAALEAPLAAAFPYPADRRLAARTIAARPAGSLPNVGALSSLTVSADAVTRDRSAVVFKERLDAARAFGARVRARTASHSATADRRGARCPEARRRGQVCR